MKASQDQDDAEANYFAMCLLVPEDLLRKAVKDRGYDFTEDRDLILLSKQFAVPMGVMALRIAEIYCGAKP